MTIFDLAPLSYWRQKRHSAQIAIRQGLAHDMLRLMLIIELQRLQLQRSERRRKELLVLLKQRAQETKQRNTAEKASGTAFDVAVEFGRYAAYSEIELMLDAQCQ